MNASDWTSRYPLIIREAERITGSAIIDAEVVCASKDGVPDFDALHSGVHDHIAIACAFDLLMRNDEDMRRKPFAERKAALAKLLFRSRDGLQSLSMPKATVKGCLPPLVISALKASSAKELTRLTDLVVLVRG